jgi:hypothetical protein
VEAQGGGHRGYAGAAVGEPPDEHLDGFVVVEEAEPQRTAAPPAAGAGGVDDDDVPLGARSEAGRDEHRYFSPVVVAGLPQKGEPAVVVEAGMLAGGAAAAAPAHDHAAGLRPGAAHAVGARQRSVPSRVAASNRVGPAH